MTITVKHKATYPKPGRYDSPVTVEWEFGNSVRKIAHSINDLEPVISEYIAYDTLSPPTPFIAVTQDGAGNVCYDGGFPKFYNGGFVGDPTTFNELTASYKYLYNALMFIANKDKFAAGNRKILIIGDANSGRAYNVKDSTGNSFNGSLTKFSKVNLNDVPGDNWIFSYKTPSDYAAGLLDPTLTELEDYVACVMFSTVTTAVPQITDNGTNDLVSYRRQGNGLMFITDHGAVITDIETAKNGTYSGFFRTANKVTVNFGAWFTGNYNRSPVNVGFLRNEYGDHPLYNGMTDAESIFAGGSESKVIVDETIELLDPLTFGSTIVDQPGINNLNFLLLGDEGEIITVRYVYIIGDTELLYFKDVDDVTLIDTVNIGFSNSLIVDIGFNGELVDATVKGLLYLNDLLIGEFIDDESGTLVDWYAGAGNPLFVDNGDVIRAVVDTPFSLEETLTVVRLQPDLTGVNSLSDIVSKLTPIVPTIKTKDVLKATINRINSELTSLTYKNNHAVNVKTIKDFMRGDYKLPSTEAYIYDTAEDIDDALAVLVPPTPKEIFDGWDRIRNDEYYPKGQSIPSGNEAAAWTWNESLQSAVMPLNTVGFMGFVSDDLVDYYDHAVTLKSDAADDDGNGLILAFSREDGINHMLIAMVNTGYNGHGGRDVAGAANVSIIYKAGGAGQVYGTILKSSNLDDVKINWLGRYKRVSVQRRGDTFNVKFSLWNTLTYAEELNLSVNLDDHVELERFKGPKNYGYYNHSQANSYFLDVDYYSGLLRDIIIDARSNKVYKYRIGTGWELLPDVTPHGVYGTPRELISPNGSRFLLNKDGTVTTL